MDLKPELLLAAEADLGEGPSWDVSRDCLVWVDIFCGLVHLTEASGERRASYDVGDHVSAALPTRDGSWLLALRAGFALLTDDGTIRPLLDVLVDRPDLRFNDAKCDARGRAFAGTTTYDGTLRMCKLYRLDPGPVAAPVVHETSISNGLGWSPDGYTMYFADSPTQTVWAYAFDPEAGTLGEARPLVVVPDEDGMPDGLCVDADGCLWVAFWDGAAVRRYTPDGALDAVVPMPVARPTSCCFGGDGSTLYVTSARNGLTDADLSEQPLAGSVFAVQTPTTGEPAVPWSQNCREPRLTSAAARRPPRNEIRGDLPPPGLG